MKPVDTLLCGRRKHIVARLYADGGLRVEAREVVDGVDGYAIHTATYTAAALDSETASSAITVACPCRKQYVVDLAPAFRARAFGKLMTFRTPPGESASPNR